MRVASIVEGEGECAALPILLRRLAAEREPSVAVDALPPIRVRRDRFLNKDEEFRRQLLLAAAKCEEDGWILILLDADDDCPRVLAADIVRRAQQVVPHRSLSVVLANREFEAWFIAAGQSLDGVRGFAMTRDDRVDAEAIRNAKGWVGERMQARTYSEVRDQPALTARIDLQQAHDNSRSFRKLCKEWLAQVAVPRQAGAQVGRQTGESH